MRCSGWRIIIETYIFWKMFAVSTEVQNGDRLERAGISRLTCLALTPEILHWRYLNKIQLVCSYCVYGLTYVLFTPRWDYALTLELKKRSAQAHTQNLCLVFTKIRLWFILDMQKLRHTGSNGVSHIDP